VVGLDPAAAPESEFWRRVSGEVAVRQKTVHRRGKEKGPLPVGKRALRYFGFFSSASDRSNVLGLQALGALLHVELNLLTFRQGPEAFDLDRRVVAENVFAATVLRDETKALRIVEPFH
jgi:hypothetical protein